MNTNFFNKSCVGYSNTNSISLTNIIFTYIDRTHITYSDALLYYLGYAMYSIQYALEELWTWVIRQAQITNYSVI